MVQLIDRFTYSPITRFLYDGVPQENFIWTFLYFAVAYTYMADMFITILLSANRFITIKFTFYYKQVL